MGPKAVAFLAFSLGGSGTGKVVTFHTELQAVDSETTLSVYEDLEQLDCDLDSTLPYD